MCLHFFGTPGIYDMYDIYICMMHLNLIILILLLQYETSNLTEEVLQKTKIDTGYKPIFVLLYTA